MPTQLRTEQGCSEFLKYRKYACTFPGTVLALVDISAEVVLCQCMYFEYNRALVSHPKLDMRIAREVGGSWSISHNCIAHIVLCISPFRDMRFAFSIAWWRIQLAVCTSCVQ